MSKTKSIMTQLQAENLLEGSFILEQVAKLKGNVRYSTNSTFVSFEDYFLVLQDSIDGIKTIKLLDKIPPMQGTSYQNELITALEEIQDSVEKWTSKATSFLGNLTSAKGEIEEQRAAFESWYCLAATEVLDAGNVKLSMTNIKALGSSEFNRLMDRSNLTIDALIESAKVEIKRLASKRAMAKQKFDYGREQVNASWANMLPTNQGVSTEAPKFGLLQKPELDDAGLEEALVRKATEVPTSNPTPFFKTGSPVLATIVADPVLLSEPKSSDPTANYSPAEKRVMAVVNAALGSDGELPKQEVEEEYDEFMDSSLNIRERQRAAHPLPYKIHVSQGQGDDVIDSFASVAEALRYIHENEGAASFGLEYPDGTWHDWTNNQVPQAVVILDSTLPKQEFLTANYAKIEERIAAINGINLADPYSAPDLDEELVTQDAFPITEQPAIVLVEPTTQRERTKADLTAVRERREHIEAALVDVRERRAGIEAELAEIHEPIGAVMDPVVTNPCCEVSIDIGEPCVMTAPVDESVQRDPEDLVHVPVRSRAGVMMDAWRSEAAFIPPAERTYEPFEDESPSYDEAEPAPEASEKVGGVSRVNVAFDDFDDLEPEMVEVEIGAIQGQPDVQSPAPAKPVVVAQTAPVGALETEEVSTILPRPRKPVAFDFDEF